MRDETEIDLLASNLLGEKYDEACKRLLKNKEIIAPILQMLIEEYKECTIEEVIRYIDADSISDDTPVVDIPVDIRQDNTEFSSVSDKLVRFDSLFRAINPKLSDGELIVNLHIDIDVQNEYKPGNPPYPIVKRGIYYASREIGRQLGTITETTDYNRLEKVYSIWICNEDIPTDLQNTVTEYDFTKKDIIGCSDEPDKDYDLLSVIIVRRGDESTENGIFDYLSGLFESNLQKISRYVDTDKAEEYVKEVKGMTGIGAALAKKYKAEGRRDGIDEGKTQSIERLTEYFMSQNPELTKEQAKEMATKILK